MDQFHVAGMPSRVLPRDAVTLAWVSLDCASGAACADPRNTIAYPLDMPAGVAVPFLRAAPGSGRGEYIVTLTFDIRVPATAYAGTYTTNIGVTITSGR